MEEKLAKFDRQIEKVKKFLDERNLPFMVVGSGALLKCGIPLRREVSDIDLEVCCTEEQEKVFKDLQDATNPYNTDYRVLDSSKPYIFMYRNIKVNVWVVKEFTHDQWVMNNGIRYATIYSVLKKKMSYRRVKDYEDLNHIVKTLLEI